MPSRKTAKAEFRTSHKKGLDEMSDAHRAKIERWEPMLSAIGAEHVWASSPRFKGRGDGLFYLAVKVASKNYAIVEFDTSRPTVKAKALKGGITSPKTLLEEYGAYRLKAKSEKTGKVTKAAKVVAKTISKPKPKTIPKPIPKPKGNRVVVGKQAQAS